jgi:hypothetical protein
MASLGSFTTSELKHELEKRANPKYKEILFDHIRYLEDELLNNAESLTLHVHLKRIKTRLKENLLPLEDY